jgi:membrane protein YdbS with pleckstrin-like domain
MILTKEEEGFVSYWEQNRERKKKVFRQLSIGLPMAVVLIAAIFINFFSGWFKRADAVLRREQSSLILVLIVAALLIVAFIVIFSVKHKWDLNEQHYRELINKKNKN